MNIIKGINELIVYSCFECNDNKLGTVVYSYGECAVADSSAYNHCCAVFGMYSLAVIREKALCGHKKSAEIRNSELSAVMVSRKDKVQLIFDINREHLGTVGK